MDFKLAPEPGLFFFFFSMEVVLILGSNVAVVMVLVLFCYFCSCSYFYSLFNFWVLALSSAVIQGLVLVLSGNWFYSCYLS